MPTIIVAERMRAGLQVIEVESPALALIADRVADFLQQRG
jgi:hypothetical protein